MSRVSGYHYFIKNLRKVILLCSIFFPVILYGASAVILKDPQLFRWQGFFTPKILLCSGDDVSSACKNKYQNNEKDIPSYNCRKDCNSKSPEECMAVDSLHAVKTYLKVKDKKVYDVVIKGGQVQICAQPILTCNTLPLKIIAGIFGSIVAGPFGPIIVGATAAAGAFGGKEVSKLATGDEVCYNLPLAPPPPPFCDQFEAPPKIGIVPVKESSFANPQIKFVVNAVSVKQCDNGTIIAIGASCADGSRGMELKSHDKIVKLTNNDVQDFAIKYGIQKYHFKAYQAKNKVCGEFLGNDDDLAGSLAGVPIYRSCYDIPGMKKPLIGTYNDKRVKITIPETKREYTLVYGADAMKVGGGYKFKLIKPKVDEERKFALSIKCKDNSPATKSAGGRMTCQDKSFPTVAYVEDKNSNVMCLLGWNPTPAEYVIIRNNRLFTGRSLGRAFIRDRTLAEITREITRKYANSTIDERIVTDELNFWLNAFYIQQLSQNTLDSIQENNDRYLMTQDGKSSRFIYNDVYKYIALSSPPVQDVSYNTVTIAHKKFFILGSNIVDYSNKPVFFTKSELLDREYKVRRPRNPFLLDLCVPRFPYIEYTKVDKQEYYFTVDHKNNKCDFVTLEAWGGGASGYIFTDSNDKKTAKYGKSFSGAAGGYVKAVMHITPNSAPQVFKISFTNIPKNNSYTPGGIPGHDTEISLCANTRDKVCKKLLLAKGGDKWGQAGNNLIYDRQKLLYQEIVNGAGGIPETSLSPNPRIPTSYITGNANHTPKQAGYLPWKDSRCSHVTDNKNNPLASMDNTRYPGTGGCVVRSLNIWQKGTNGKARITCEQWKKSSS